MKHPTKHLLAAAVLLLTSPRLANATSYYVDAVNGNDTSPGSRTAPWKTLTKAADTMASGDTAYVRTGTYRETVRPRHGQTFEAYPGEKPLITGCDPVKGWRRHAGSIYQVPVEARVLDVFVGQRYMQKARHPNEDGDPMTATEWAASTLSLISNAGRGTGKVVFRDGMDRPEGHWAGGWYSGLHGNNHWMASEGRIVASRGREITCTDLNSIWGWGDPSHSGEGWGYITDHLNCLDAEGEWHWQEGTLYFWAPDGGRPVNVQVRTRIYGFELVNVSRVTVKGLYFLGASLRIEGGRGNVVDGCHFRYVSPWGAHYYTDARGPYDWGGPVDGTSGIDISGKDHVIRNCSIVGGWGSGVRLSGGTYLSVVNNYIADFGWIARQGAAPLSGFGTDLHVERNTIRRSANAGLLLSQKSRSAEDLPTNLVRRPRLLYNDLREVGYLLEDSGHCFMYLSNGDAPSDERYLDGEIAYNVCVGLMKRKDFAGGIYLDNGTDYCTLHHNVVNCLPGLARCGIFLYAAGHRQENLFCYHNTLWGYQDGGWGAAIQSGANSAAPGRANLVFSNNLAQHSRYAGINWDTLSWTTQGLTLFHNRENVPASEFVDVAHANFRLRDGSSGIDAGVVIPGINDVGSESPYAGRAPDLGAYEFGGVDWTAGSTVTPPPFPED